MIDLHIHSIFSDGTDSVEKIIDKLIKQNISYFSITDHDNIESAKYIFSNKELISILSTNSISFVNGVELSCEQDNDKFHLLVYNFDVNNQKLINVITEAKNNRKLKLDFRIEALKKDFNIILSSDSIKYLNSIDNVGKPHIAQCLVKDGYYSNIEQCFSECLNKIKKIEINTSNTLNAIFNAIKEAKGICVLAHPYGESDNDIKTDEQVENTILKLINYGLVGIECYYSNYSKEQIKKLLQFAKKYNLYVASGSDYHGANKTIKLGSVCNNYDYDLSGNEVNIIKLFK